MTTTDPILIDALIAADYLEERANSPEAALLAAGEYLDAQGKERGE